MESTPDNNKLPGKQDAADKDQTGKPASGAGPGQQNDDLPGYPHYPASEDIMDASSKMKRVDADVENITRAGNISDADLEAGVSLPRAGDLVPPVPDDIEAEDEIGIVPGTEADVTKDDLIALGPKDRDMDMGEDEQMQGHGVPLAETGDDLDVPGEELDDADEALGEEDEENNYYSLGGDAHENLEEDPSGGL